MRAVSIRQWAGAHIKVLTGIVKVVDMDRLYFIHRYNSQLE